MKPNWVEKKPYITIIIPVYNEKDNISTVIHNLYAVMVNHYDGAFETIVINDGSIDGTDEVLDELSQNTSFLFVIHLQVNRGQTSAMMAGFDHARGEIIIALDGDGQNDAQDIPFLLEEINKGADVVSGWRKDRKDSPVRRNFLSRVANKLISHISGVHLHDYGCSLKAYRKNILQGFRLYGEMHRLIPIYIKWSGGKIVEIPVRHHPRTFGVSKYGVERTLKVVLDLIVVMFLHTYFMKPMYVFGTFGIVCITFAGIAGLGAVILKVIGYASFIQTPLPLLFIMGVISGVVCILMGLIAEMLARIYYESQGKTTYIVKRKTIPSS